jgi:Flp pilus assembly protein TadG
MSSCLNRFRALVADFAHRRDGVVALLFGLLLPVLLAFVLGLIDYTRASSTQLALQTNLDAAALYIARSNATTQADVTAMGKRMMDANADNLKHGTVTSYTFTLTADQRVVATAAATVPVTIASLLGKSEVPVDASAEVTRNANSVEVSLVLDVTGSMAQGTKLADLKVAAKDLVDLVVKDTQTPFYSKVALVPYSMGVNVDTYATQVRGSYASGSSTTPGSRYYEFNAPVSKDNNKTDKSPYPRKYEISTCVSERAGAEAFTDAPPSTALLGRNYPATKAVGAVSPNPCLGSKILPLSSNRTTLKNSIDSLQASGSTGGHIGVAWGWYMVSPNFGYLWSGASAGAAYGTKDLLKVVVIMTDGEYNSIYYNGVIAKNSLTGSGADADHINQNAPNGDPYFQAQKLCENMKDKGVIVYTVGLNIENTQAARDLVNKCATDASRVYLPSGGTALKDAFRAIAQEINSLRISK